MANEKAETVKPLTLDDYYRKAASEPSDINEHVPTLRDLAIGQGVVVEFGVRTAVSTAALLMGKPKEMYSYDIHNSAQARLLSLAVDPLDTHFVFTIADSLACKIPVCDLLFIDTTHTAEQVYKELTRHAGQVRKRIAFHDTETFGEQGEDGGAGLMVAIRRFLRENLEWVIVRHDTNNHGFTVISRVLSEHPTL